MKGVICLVLMLLISSISIFPASVSADWNPGDEYKMHFPQLPDPSGWDVNATIINESYPYLILADDWLCTETGYVNDIHFWGSWANDSIGVINAFSLRIYADIPADFPLIPYSRPGELLWEKTVYPDHWVQSGPFEGLQGWYDPIDGLYVYNQQNNYWQYNIEDIEDPFIQEEETVYWFSISAMIETENPQSYWGWKSSDYHWNDHAVYTVINSSTSNIAGNWTNLTEPPVFEQALDFSFVINGEPVDMNQPPNTPIKPNGPSYGTVGEYLPYTTSTTDPDMDYIKYGFDLNSNDIVDYWTSSYYPSGATCGVYIRFGLPGTYYIRVKAKDTHEATSDWSPPKMVVITGVNNPPSIPSKPSGPSSGIVNMNYTFQTSATDPDGDDIKYGWDWNGDGLIDEWTGFYQSGETVNVYHQYLSPGTYYISVVAEDEEGAQSDFSPEKIIVIAGGNGPNQPLKPAGPTTGMSGISYIYSTSTIDPDGDSIYYLFDWGDGTDSGWIGPYNSGSTVIISHIWITKGTFIVKVKAKDDPNGDGNLDDGKESPWSDPLAIQMPKSKMFNHYILQFLEEHSILFNFLKFLLT